MLVMLQRLQETREKNTWLSNESTVYHWSSIVMTVSGIIAALVTSGGERRTTCNELWPGASLATTEQVTNAPESSDITNASAYSVWDRDWVECVSVGEWVGGLNVRAWRSLVGLLHHDFMHEEPWCISLQLGWSRSKAYSWFGNN